MAGSVLHTSKRAFTIARAAKAVRSLRRAGSPEQKLLARMALAEVLGDARGLLMKAGQALARPGADDPLEALLFGVEPVPLAGLRPELEREMNVPISHLFSDFSARGIAASLGQVHRARLTSGEPVAVKIQYPFIERSVQAELALAGLAPGVGKVKSWGFDLDGYKRELATNMRRELDYLDEASRQARFRAAVQVDGLYIPRVFPQLSTRRVLVSEWVEGQPLAEARALSLSERTHLGRVLLETLLCSVFVAHHVHGDPHPGNLYFTRQHAGLELCLLDFGCTLDLRPEAALALLGLIARRRAGLFCDPLGVFVQMGFDEARLQLLGPKLRAFSDLLLEPFLSDKACDLRAYRLGERTDQLLAEQKWHFRAAGPPRLFLLLRAFSGVFAQLAALDVRLPFYAVLTRAVGEAALAEAARRTPAGATRKLQATSGCLLTIRVERGGRPNVWLAFPGEAALELSELVPEEVREKLDRDGVDLRAIEREVRDRGLAPRTLLCHHSGDVRYELKLEAQSP